VPLLLCEEALSPTSLSTDRYGSRMTCIVNDGSIVLLSEEIFKELEELLAILV
jgi:hypothetical protein